MRVVKIMYGALLLVILPAGKADLRSNLPAKKQAQRSTVSGVQQLIRQIPVLCYHNIKYVIEGSLPAYTISVDRFREHLCMLADNGYQTVTPAQIVSFIESGTPLPHKPVMLSFDDTRAEHYAIAAPLLDSLGFKGVFFITTAYIDKKGCMTAAQIKALSDRGHIIGNHSYDHPNMRLLTEGKWDMEISGASQVLERITGKPVIYFAYPYGIWNHNIITQLKSRNIKAAWQLEDRVDSFAVLYSQKRTAVSGDWSAALLQRYMRIVFRQKLSDRN